MNTITLTITCTNNQTEDILKALRAVQDTLYFDGIHAEIKTENQN